ncbi:hypothetical protein STRAU_2654 [Streptomyces aurantiacus JA 4570]|uniref:Uncharacterized protein n=2 Tax=Streptomyces aurantiacus TaxID=47760 RepID=S3ZN58_9ACTN|nr:hypothetical protein STRAU_2654 [Streptomyces aurantiacus JA 4570]
MGDGAMDLTRAAVAELRALERTTLTLHTPRHPGWRPVFPLAHLAEHLLGRELGRLPGLSALTGHLRKDVITVRFLLSPAGRAGLDVDRIVELADTSPADFAQEQRVLAVEDAILPEALRSAGRLPASLARFREEWRRTEPRPTLVRQPFVSSRLAELLDPATPPPPPPDHTAAAGAGTARDGGTDERREHAEALAAVRRRTGGQEPELFLCGGPLDQYWGATSVLLAGLSAYRSALFRQLREGPRPVYCLKLFDFPWRSRRYVACVTRPAVGPAAFRADIGPRAAEIVRNLGPADLRTVLAEGRLAVLDEFVSVLDHPPRRAWVPLLARLNGFSARPADLARPVLDCAVGDLARCRDAFLVAYTRELRRDASEHNGEVANGQADKGKAAKEKEDAA